MPKFMHRNQDSQQHEHHDRKAVCPGEHEQAVCLDEQTGGIRSGKQAGTEQACGKRSG